MKLGDRYRLVRQRTEYLCSPLQVEDYVVQPVIDVSPPKWHLGHTTWFFETLVLQPWKQDYKVCNADYNYVFNSYYESLGARVIRTDRGNLSRPTVSAIYEYRKYVDDAMMELLNSGVSPELEAIVVLGLNHEEQHQELLMTDVKYILGHNPLFPPYDVHSRTDRTKAGPENRAMMQVAEGIYEIGYRGDGFCYDNELGAHKVYLHAFEIAAEPVRNRDMMAFMEAGGYRDFRWWHAEGLDWVKNNEVHAPMYWHSIDGNWLQYTLHGLEAVDPEEWLCHVSFYEASALAAWRGMRLPTEFEWEAAARQMEWGSRWEWTNSAYLPYPGFVKAGSAIGEYNGKFMVNQMVLRGASAVTPPGHSRITYRNFFHPYLRWQYTGVRLAR